ncbi:Alcohol dehydrogenase [NADP(+)] [Chionoecetes opilio]|uniref:Alcohol dehydrogenase [NADP(+)] n=1 Tax=Chionoecetes opilio TaxID=41210 RepID=A0A8J5CIC9_CHIOP|nr:Alcohol dehydrogenase [NADP(+)] [Chionoecetes opilio]
MTTMMPKVPAACLNNRRVMPMIGIGTLRAYGDDVKVALNTALECGYRHINTAFLYQNETVIGEVLKEWFTSGRLKREDVFITTKLPTIGNREKDMSRFLQKSQDMLGLAYVDLYLVHFPVGLIGKDDNDIMPKDEEGNVALDFETNLEGIWRGMEAQVDAGKAKSIGISNFNSMQIKRIIKVARNKPANQQVKHQAHHRQPDLQRVCKQHGIAVCAYGPIGAPYKKSGTKEFPHLLERPVVSQIAKAHGKTAAQVLLRHLIQHDVIVIPKSANVERIKQNFQVLDFAPNPEDMAKLDALNRGGAGRTFIFKDFFRGIEKHPEFPFNAPF